MIVAAGASLAIMTILAPAGLHFETAEIRLVCQHSPANKVRLTADSRHFNAGCTLDMLKLIL